MRTRPNPSTEQLLLLMRGLILPMTAVERTIKLPAFGRWENDADHSFQLAILGCAVGIQFKELDLGKVCQYALVHDMVEVLAGDTTIWADADRHASKAAREADALRKIEQLFGGEFPWVHESIGRYERLDEPESRFVYALDKVIPYPVMLSVQCQPYPATRLVYDEKIRIAREKIGRYPDLLPSFESLERLAASCSYFFADELDLVVAAPDDRAERLLSLFRELLIPMSGIERTVELPGDVRRSETVAEHSYILATLGCALAHRIDSTLDLGKVAQYGLAHDLVEVYAGDTKVFGPEQELASKPDREAQALRRIEARFGGIYPWLAETIQAYERLDEPESRFVYALDKILPHAIICVTDRHPVQPTWERYQWSERVARKKIGEYSALLPYFDDLCALFAGRPHYFAGGVPAKSRS